MVLKGKKKNQQQGDVMPLPPLSWLFSNNNTCWSVLLLFYHSNLPMLTFSFLKTCTFYPFIVTLTIVEHPSCYHLHYKSYKQLFPHWTLFFVSHEHEFSGSCTCFAPSLSLSLCGAELSACRLSYVEPLQWVSSPYVHAHTLSFSRLFTSFCNAA